MSDSTGQTTEDESNETARAGFTFICRNPDLDLPDECIIYRADEDAPYFVALSKLTGKTGIGDSREDAFLDLIINVGGQILRFASLNRLKATGFGFDLSDDPRFQSINGFHRLKKNLSDEAIDEAKRLLGLPEHVPVSVAEVGVNNRHDVMDNTNAHEKENNSDEKPSENHNSNGKDLGEESYSFDYDLQVTPEVKTPTPMSLYLDQPTTSPSRANAK